VGIRDINVSGNLNIGSPCSTAQIPPSAVARERGAPAAGRPAEPHLRRVARNGRWWLDGRGALLAILALLLVRLLLIGHATLIPEEAYYWMYSMHPALGYLDHPPMVAWLISAGTFVFGPTELGVRLGTWLLSAGAAWLCYRLGADWYGRRVGIATALLYALAPVFCGTGFVATPDAPLVFFWLLALVAITRAVRRERPGWWILAGIAVGLAFLSKYPAAFLVPSTFLFLLSDKRGRRMLTRPWPWVALALALAVASPVIWWNAQHDWASFRFQFLRRVGEHGHLAPLKTLSWIGAQFAVVSPLIFAALIGAFVLALRRFRHDSVGRWRFAACFAAPWLAVCLWHGLFTEVKINWPLPAYLGLLPVGSVLFRKPGLMLFPGVSRALHWKTVARYTVGMAAVDTIILLYISIPIAGTPRPELMAPWVGLGNAAETAEDDFAQRTGREPFILVDGKYKLASELAFYMRDPDQSVNDWNDVIPIEAAIGGGLNFMRWHNPHQLLGRDAILIAKDLKARKLAVLKNSFAHVGQATLLYTHRVGWRGEQRYWIIPCRDFRGVPEPDKP